jgi:branched-chain amino acid transport system permease protein
MAGVLLAPIYSVFPTMGRDFVLIAFSVVIIGGMLANDLQFRD